MIDDRLLSKQFSTGDIVRVTSDSGTFLSPFPGRVLYSNHESGVVVVQFPWGVEHAAASSLLIDYTEDYSAPVSDTSYSTWEKARYSHQIARKYMSGTIIPLYRLACRNSYLGMTEMQSFADLQDKVGSIFTVDEIRGVVSSLMQAGRKLAIYRKEIGRKYKRTQSELQSGVSKCPRCKDSLHSRRSRQDEVVLICRSCGFCISPEDLI